MEDLKDEFTRQCWYTWTEGFRYSYKEDADVDKAIEEADKIAEAFKNKFKE